MNLNLPRKIKVIVSEIILKYLSFVIVSLRQAVYQYQSKSNVLGDIIRLHGALMQNLINCTKSTDTI